MALGLAFGFHLGLYSYTGSLITKDYKVFCQLFANAEVTKSATDATDHEAEKLVGAYTRGLQPTLRKQNWT